MKSTDKVTNLLQATKKQMMKDTFQWHIDCCQKNNIIYLVYNHIQDV